MCSDSLHIEDYFPVFNSDLNFPFRGKLLILGFFYFFFFFSGRREGWLVFGSWISCPQYLFFLLLSFATCIVV